MSASADEVLATLKSIDASLKLLVGKSASVTVPVAALAPDSDLDNPNGYGNPEVRAKSPRDWSGDSQLGKRFSECPPEYLDLVASRLDYFAEQNSADADPEVKKKAQYNRKDAARARSWAQRLRNGWKPEPTSAFGDQDAALTADEIPFALILCAALGHALISVLC